MSKLSQIFPAFLLCELFSWVVYCFVRSAEWPGWAMTCNSRLGSLDGLVILPDIVPDYYQEPENNSAINSVNIDQDGKSFESDRSFQVP